MKLKNKKTGEIVSLEGELLFDNEVMLLKHYASLAELNAEWEDVPEEPKEYWCIDWTGGINHITVLDGVDKYEENKKQIGNYFETKEEAEKAVEKLKAWKRLKDEYDFKFTGWKRDEQFRGDFIITAQDWNTSDDNLLNLLFGGEE